VFDNECENVCTHTVRRASSHHQRFGRVQVELQAGQRIEYKYVVLEEQVSRAHKATRRSLLSCVKDWRAGVYWVYYAYVHMVAA